MFVGSRRTLLSAVSWTPETRALVARMTVRPTANRIRLIDNLVRALKSAGTWQAADLLYVEAAHDAQAARLNWIADANNLTAVASPTFTVDRGYQGDGAASYLSTGKAANALTKASQNSITALVWSLTDSAAANTYDLGGSASNGISMVGRTNVGALGIRANSNTGENYTTANSLGFYGFSRTGASAGAIYKNGVNVQASATTSIALSGSVIEIGHSTGGYSARQIAAAYVGATLTDAQHAAFYAALRAYLIAIGATT